MKRESAILVVDIQGDFTEWKHGSLAVPDTGEDYVSQVEHAVLRLKEAGFRIFASQDWHPPDHMSFAVNHEGKKPMDRILIDGRTQVLWPAHCVQGTENARVLIDNSLFLAIVRKGQDPKFDSYSVFQDDGGRKTELEGILAAHNIGRLIVFGLTTDYCVRATALDALPLRHEVVVVQLLCRGIQPDSSAEAIRTMKEHGARIIKNIEDI